MNKVSVIRKERVKSYLLKGLVDGFLIGILVFLITLVKYSALNSLYFGLISWGGVILIWMGIVFTSKEYFKRKKKIKKLTSDTFAFLYEHDFVLDDCLHFEGIYKGYFFRVFHKIEWLGGELGIWDFMEYVTIESFYTSDSLDDEREAKMCGMNFLGNVKAGYNCITLLPRDCQNPDFKKDFDGLISILKREKLAPISEEDWNNTAGKKLKQDRKDAKKARTKLILKIGRMNIEYIKPDKMADRKPFLNIGKFEVNFIKPNKEVCH
jgi:hypothetical protein